MFQVEKTASMKVKYEKKLDIPEIMRSPLNSRNLIEVLYAEYTI